MCEAELRGNVDTAARVMMNKDTETSRHGILVDRVDVLVRILKLALCRIDPVR